MKRLLDILLTLPALILTAPGMFLIGLLIRLESQGPAIFSQQRAGQGGRAFTFYKFRTMRLDVDPYGPSPKAGDDPRLTKIGKFLRETSLDELPQLLNILKGDMTLVGPRPLYVQQIAEWNDRQRRRLEVKPGLTGLAQISGRGGLTQEEKLELDVQYVENHSLSRDLWILMATAGAVVGQKDIYEKRYSQTQETRES